MLEVITIVVANDSEILKLTTGLEKEQVIAVLREAADPGFRFVFRNICPSFQNVCLR